MEPLPAQSGLVRLRTTLDDGDGIDLKEISDLDDAREQRLLATVSVASQQAQVSRSTLNLFNLAGEDALITESIDLNAHCPLAGLTVVSCQPAGAVAEHGSTSD